jgi:DNA-binding MarR family transcriptional regulator
MPTLQGRKRGDHEMVKGQVRYDPRVPGCPKAAALGALLRAGSRLLREIEAALAEDGFPPLRWLDVLVELDAAEAGRLTQTEIERATAITQHNLSRQLDRMEREGLVERKSCPSDRRAHHVVLTAKGKALRLAMGKAFTVAVARLVGDRLPVEDARQLGALLARLSPEAAVTG